MPCRWQDPRRCVGCHHNVDGKCDYKPDGSLLKKTFSGEVLDGYVEASRCRTLTEFTEKVKA